MDSIFHRAVRAMVDAGDGTIKMHTEVAPSGTTLTFVLIGGARVGIALEVYALNMAFRHEKHLPVIQFISEVMHAALLMGRQAEYSAGVAALRSFISRYLATAGSDMEKWEKEFMRIL